MQDIEKSEKLEELLRKDYPEELVDQIMEIDSVEFRRTVEQSIMNYYTQIQIYQLTLEKARDYARTNYVVYFRLPDKTVGYYVLDKKQFGFLK